MAYGENQFDSLDPTPPDSATSSASAAQLRAFVGRIEKLEEEKAAISADIKEVYLELKATGFDPKITRQIVRLRKMEVSDRVEQQELLDTYQRALGMLL